MWICKKRPSIDVSRHDLKTVNMSTQLKTEKRLELICGGSVKAEFFLIINTVRKLMGHP